MSKPSQGNAGPIKPELPFCVAPPPSPTTVFLFINKEKMSKDQGEETTPFIPGAQLSNAGLVARSGNVHKSPHPNLAQVQCATHSEKV